MSSKSIYPVEGSYLNGFPHVALRTDAETAARLVRTGAYQFEGKGETEPFELAPHQLERLDTYYDPPERHRPKAEAPETETPADAGVSDSTPEE